MQYARISGVVTIIVTVYVFVFARFNVVVPVQILSAAAGWLYFATLLNAFPLLFTGVYLATKKATRRQAWVTIMTVLVFLIVTRMVVD